MRNQSMPIFTGSKSQDAAHRIRVFCLNLYIVALPLNALSSQTGLSIIKYIAIAIAAISLFTMGTTWRIHLSKVKWYWIIYVLYSAVTLLWANARASSLTAVIGMAETAVLALVLCNDTFTENDIRKIETAFMLSGYFMLLLVLSWGVADSTDRVVIRSSFAIADGNEMNAFFIIPAILCVQRIMKKQQRLLFKLLYAATLVAFLYCVLLTGSRSGFLGFIAAVLLTFLYISGLQMKKLASVVLAIAVLIALYLYVIKPMLPADMLQRFSYESMVSDKGSNRLDIWQQQISIIRSDPLRLVFGYGRGGIASYRRASHNQLLQELICGGIFGLCIYIGFIINLLKNAKKNYKPSFYAVIAIQVMLLFLSSTSSFKPVWIIYMMAISYVNKKTNTIEEIK